MTRPRGRSESDRRLGAWYKRDVSDQSVVVEGISSLASGQSKTFTFDRDGEMHPGFLIRVGDEFFAFANRCPHWNVDLDMGNGDFFVERLAAVVCRNHGALFDPRTGACWMGPCAGQRLEQFPLSVASDRAVVTIATTQSSAKGARRGSLR